MFISFPSKGIKTRTADFVVADGGFIPSFNPQVCASIWTGIGWFLQLLLGFCKTLIFFYFTKRQICTSSILIIVLKSLLLFPIIQNSSSPWITVRSIVMLAMVVIGHRWHCSWRSLFFPVKFVSGAFAQFIILYSIGFRRFSLCSRGKITSREENSKTSQVLTGMLYLL